MPHCQKKKKIKPLKNYLVLEILLENTARRTLQGQIATEDILLATLNDEYKKLERKFEFVKDMHTERMDMIP